METVGERDYTGRVRPQAKESARFSRRGGGYGGSFEKRDVVDGGVKGGMSGQVVCRCCADYTTPWTGALVDMFISDGYHRHVVVCYPIFS